MLATLLQGIEDRQRERARMKGKGQEKKWDLTQMCTLKLSVSFNLQMKLTMILMGSDLESILHQPILALFLAGFKTVIALGTITFSMVLYHSNMHSLRVHVCPGEAQLTWTSSLLYFLWNFFLIASRVMAVALATSALPSGMIVLHFLCLWFGLFFWAWCQRTDFMKSPAGEWL